MPPAHFLNAPTYRRRHHGGSGAHRRRDRGDHQEFLISLLILCKTEDVSTSSVLFYCQTLSLRASPQTGVAIRIPSLSPSVGVGVPDDPHAQPPCHAVGATLAVARRTPQPLSLRTSAHAGVAIRTPSLSPSVGVGVPDDPPLTAAPPLIPRRTAPMCAAADHRRTFKPCHCEPVRTLVWQSVPPSHKLHFSP